MKTLNYMQEISHEDLMEAIAEHGSVQFKEWMRVFAEKADLAVREAQQRWAHGDHSVEPIQKKQA